MEDETHGFEWSIITCATALKKYKSTYAMDTSWTFYLCGRCA